MPKQIGKVQNKLQVLKANPYYEDLALGLYLYIDGTIPIPAVSQETYWSLSCLPSTNGNSRLCAVSILKMETLVVGINKSGYDELDAHRSFVNVDEKKLKAKYPTKAAFVKKHKYASWERTAYESNLKANVVCARLNVCGLQNLIRLLGDDAVIDGARSLNWELMKRGKTSYGRYHCAELASDVLSCGRR